MGGTGIQPSYAFVEQPQTNGVAERFNRTLKEQIIHGRIYRNIAELRNAVRGFVEQYNAQWIVEKNGYLSPAHAIQSGLSAMKTSQDQKPIKDLVELFKSQMMIANPEYQRGVVWNEAQQKRLIDSLFRGFTLPLIYLHEKKE